MRQPTPPTRGCTHAHARTHMAGAARWEQQVGQIRGKPPEVAASYNPNCLERAPCVGSFPLGHPNGGTRERGLPTGVLHGLGRAVSPRPHANPPQGPPLRSGCPLYRYPTGSTTPQFHPGAVVHGSHPQLAATCRDDSTMTNDVFSSPDGACCYSDTSRVSSKFRLLSPRFPRHLYYGRYVSGSTRMSRRAFQNQAATENGVSCQRRRRSRMVAPYGYRHCAVSPPAPRYKAAHSSLGLLPQILGTGCT